MLSNPQQYCLRWNNHQHNLLSVFEDLLHNEAFVDVTLACDGQQVRACSTRILRIVFFSFFLEVQPYYCVSTL